MTVNSDYDPFVALRCFTINGMRHRFAAPSRPVYQEQVAFHRERITHTIRYMSDGIQVEARVHRPIKDGTQGLVILNHGYENPTGYLSGRSTALLASMLLQSGFVVAVPDFRCWGGSECGDNLFRAGYVADLLNLMLVLQDNAHVDTSRVGLWGYSLGAGIACKAMVVHRKFKAAVLVGTVSPRDEDIFERWTTFDIELATKNAELLKMYKRAIASSEFLAETSPLSYFRDIETAVQLHHGSDDQATPVAWSQQIEHMLRINGKPVELHIYPNQGHFFDQANRITMLMRTVEFFKKYLSP